MTTPEKPPLDCPDCPGKMYLQETPFENGNHWIYLCENRPRCRGLMSAHPDGTPTGIPAPQEIRTARPLRTEWVRSLVRQCRPAGTACFVKQMGKRVIDRNDAGFEGGDPAEWPDDLSVREFPEALQ